MEDTILAESNGLKEMEDDNHKIECPKVSEERKQQTARIAETEEPVMPRPLRVRRMRKSVGRFVDVVEPDPIRKFRVEKGCGTALKDIPNEQQIENERLRKELRDKDEALEQSQELNNVLILKELQLNNELQQIRKLLIRGIGECSSQHSVVQLREMGEIDRKPFLEALEDKCNSSSEEQVSSQSAKLCSFWEEMLKDQTWHPFKVTLVDGKQQELVDEGDRLLKGLKNEWGEKVYDAVVNALVELNEYNPSGRNSVQELWNFKEKRKATLIGVSYVLNRLKKHPITTTTTATTSTPRK